MCRGIASCLSSFNPRPRAGGDGAGYGVRAGYRCFNPRPRAGGDHACRLRGMTSNALFQSTPPRGGRRLAAMRVPMRELVSIHAPARGATLVSPRCAGTYAFQSTPPRGGRRRWPASIGIWIVSIHAPARGATVLAHAADGMVSIHAPARGATLCSCAIRSDKFQSTPPRGGRHASCAEPRASFAFQSTPPRGGRLDYPVIR